MNRIQEFINQSTSNYFLIKVDGTPIWGILNRYHAVMIADDTRLSIYDSNENREY